MAVYKVTLTHRDGITGPPFFTGQQIKAEARARALYRELENAPGAKLPRPEHLEGCILWCARGGYIITMSAVETPGSKRAWVELLNNWAGGQEVKL